MSKSNRDFVDGETIEFEYPFIRTLYSECDADGVFDVLSWKPGIRYVNVYPDDSEALADGIGRAVITVIGTHKPGKYPTRIFFTRKWLSPHGTLFGKAGLKITTVGAFRNLISGYQYDFRVATEDETANYIRLELKFPKSIALEAAE